ncbi:hypothetical protein MLD38_014652 [Melastoma candidum]|uniref:Uncharacterized protein n=1 Tax=Melastoma candidum TaxID=119954 RepID=A0ACB9RCT5_9MYRT|nr:hypothetical protein MLD38_014652 [Melastoma candidum]
MTSLGRTTKTFGSLFLVNTTSTSPMSSYSRTEINATSQSYFFTHSAKAIAVTLRPRGSGVDKIYLYPRAINCSSHMAVKVEGLIPLTDSAANYTPGDISLSTLMLFS